MRFAQETTEPSEDACITRLKIIVTKNSLVFLFRCLFSCWRRSQRDSGGRGRQGVFPHLVMMLSRRLFMILCGQKYVDALMKHYRCDALPGPRGSLALISWAPCFAEVGSARRDFWNFCFSGKRCLHVLKVLTIFSFYELLLSVLL